jgi:dihydroneopterin aldolase
MQKPVDLLETLVQTIANKVHRQFPQVKTITVAVEKLNPPIDKFSGSVEVKYTKKY